MSSIVFLRAVNVGAANRCRPADIAKQLSKLDVINIGAVGTFVVREKVSDSTLRAAFARKLPFKCEIMICQAHDILHLSESDPFAGQPSGPDITHFVSVLHSPPTDALARTMPSIPLALPSDKDWLLRVIAVQRQFVLGLYHRDMKAISYLGKLEKLLGVPGTVRNWNTIQKIAQIVKEDFKGSKQKHAK
jgi:uncharacterized protein (DUF1697 family)